jgi:hypothetical protein
MRNRSPRSFTVETKSGGRQRPIIPHRDTAPAAPRPLVFWPSAAEPKTPAPEPRRVLPNLIVPEPVPVEPEPADVAEDGLPKPRRGRPPKAKPVAAVVIEEPLAEPAVEIAAAAPATVPHVPMSRVVRNEKPLTVLPSGERWKRRLGRWAR